MLVYNDTTSIVTSWEFGGKGWGNCFGLSRKSSVFFMLEVMFLTQLCKWQSTYAEIFSVGDEIDSTIGQPGGGFIFLCTLGSI